MADNDDKVYTPEETRDEPFPIQQGEINLGTSSPSGQQIYTPHTIKDQKLPRKFIAQETIGQALNTKSKKILGEFQLTQHGAIAIGKHEPGVSGDVRITPNGLTARNIAGDPTFGLDGETGDAFFAGELRSGSLVTGQIVMGADGEIVIGDENGASILDAFGLSSINNFVSAEDSFSGDISFSSTSYANIAGLQLDLTIKRRTKTLFLLTIEVANNQTTGGLDMTGIVEIRINISDGAYISPPILIGTVLDVSENIHENVIRKTYSLAALEILDKDDYSETELLNYPVPLTVNVAYKHQSGTNLTSHIYYANLIAVALGS